MSHTLRLAAALAFAGVASCSDPSPPAQSDGVETFANPPELAPDAQGNYTLRLTPAAVEVGGQRYCLRTYNGSVPGPTIRVRAGANRRLHVTLRNELTRSDWREISGMEGHEAPSCHDFNVTNLHFHGGHVRPDFAAADPADPCVGDGCGDGQRYHGDNVLIAVQPAGMARYRWDLDEDGTHHEGTQWYHPHVHGSTAIQVINGAAGALIVEGALDAEPSVAATRERVMVIQELPLAHQYTRHLAAGEACTVNNLSVNNFLSFTEGMPMAVNGKVKPRLITAPGQVERW